MRHIRRCALVVWLLGAAATGQAVEPAGDGAIDVAALKLSYLACDGAASQRRLDFREAVGCSIVSEQLLQHGFHGDFDRLLAWWREAKLADAAKPDAPVEPAHG